MRAWSTAGGGAGSPEQVAWSDPHDLSTWTVHQDPGSMLGAGSAWSAASTVVVNNGIHGQPDVGRDGIVILSPDGIWTHSDEDLQIQFKLTWTAPTGGDGGDFTFEAGFVIDRTNPIAVNKGHVGGFRYMLSDGAVKRTSVRRYGGASSTGATFTSAIGYALVTVMMNGTQSDRAMAQSSDGARTRASAHVSSTVAISDGQSMSLMLCIGSLNTSATVDLTVTNLTIQHRVIGPGQV